MFNYLFICLALLTSLKLYAAPSQFIEFALSLEEEIFISKKQILKIGEKVRVSKPGFFDRNPNAQASYRPVTNTIVLNQSNLIITSDSLRIKNSKEMNKSKKYNIFSARAQTIFHEIAHGELDTIVESDNTHLIHYLLFSDIAPWFRKHFGFINTKTAVHELYGYAAGNIVSALYLDVENVLINHGLRPRNLECMGKKYLNKIAKIRGYKNGISFKPISKVKYSDDYLPDYIFINGKDYKIKGKDFKNSWRKHLFSYMYSVYRFPRNHRELITKMNDSLYHKALVKCFKDIVLH